MINAYSNEERIALWYNRAFDYFAERCGWKWAHPFYSKGGYLDEDGISLRWGNIRNLVDFAWAIKDYPDMKWRIYEKFAVYEADNL